MPSKLKIDGGSLVSEDVEDVEGIEGEDDNIVETAMLISRRDQDDDREGSRRRDQDDDDEKIWDRGVVFGWVDIDLVC